MRLLKPLKSKSFCTVPDASRATEADAGITIEKVDDTVVSHDQMQLQYVTLTRCMNTANCSC